MSNPNIPESQLNPEPQTSAEADASFGDLLSQFEQSHSHKIENGSRQLEGTVVTVTADSVLLDIGYKTEGILPLAAFADAGEMPKPGAKLPVTVKGRDPEGYYELTRFKVARPTDWSSLERAFAEKSTIVGTVTGMIKGGFSVDVGVRAFMPASRSGVRDAAEMEKLVEQEIRCRIIKLDTADEDVVVDRRIVAEEEEREGKQRKYAELKEGDVVSGTIRTLADYGAFVEIGGVDGLLHVSRYFVGTGQQTVRRAFGGAGDRSQGSEDRCGEAAHFAGHEAVATSPLGLGGGEIPRRASGCAARSLALPTSARSWSWSRGSKAWSTSRRCRG